MHHAMNQNKKAEEIMLISGHIDRKQHGGVVASAIVGFHQSCRCWVFPIERNTQTGLNEERD